MVKQFFLSGTQLAPKSYKKLQKFKTFEIKLDDIIPGTEQFEQCLILLYFILKHAVIFILKS